MNDRTAPDHVEQVFLFRRIGHSAQGPGESPLPMQDREESKFTLERGVPMAGEAHLRHSKAHLTHAHTAVWNSAVGVRVMHVA